MESSTATPGLIGSTTASNRSRKVRIIAKIRAFTDPKSESFNCVTNPWISVHKPVGESSESVTISFPDQPASRKESYELDYCYEKEEGNALIFSREIKPLISEVFDGQNASVFAYGARGSGKTYTIQGCDEHLGLAAMAMNEILLKAGSEGRSVTISLYEVYQDHVRDMLHPKRGEVSVLENGKGKIQLKGLSQVPVNSISEFHKLCRNGFSSQKLAHKIPTEPPCRSHKGLMVHVPSCNENLDTGNVGKMNFVDLAGYEDVRRKSGDGFNLVESTRINKSLYALHNVVHALNADENHVPYRESKLTRMLQDSLGGTNRILMITCLNPTFCQDTISMVNLASRSYQGINPSFTCSIKKGKNSTRPLFPSSSKNGKSLGASVVAKKQTSSRMKFSEKKAYDTTSAISGRKLFEEANNSTASKKDEDLQEKSTSNLSETMPLEEEPLFQTALKESELSSTVDVGKTVAVSNGLKPFVPTKANTEKTAAISNALEPSVPIKEMCTLANSLEPFAPTKDASLCSEHNLLQFTPTVSTCTKRSDFLEGHDREKENRSLQVNEVRSPPISQRLRELSNNLKSLYSSTPLCIKLPIENDGSSNLQVPTDIVEPKTPVLEPNSRFNDIREPSNMNSPWETFSARSSGMKNSLIQDYMKFLNSASKEELKKVKGIGEKRATYILELREESPEPFKNLDDLREIGLSAKQVKGLMKQVTQDLFS